MSLNTISISGNIDSNIVYSHTSYNENFYCTYMTTKRLSGVEDVLQLIIREKLINCINTNDRIEIIGEIRSFNKYDNALLRYRLCLSILVHQINHENFEKDSNKLEIEGLICRKPIFRQTPNKRQICDVLLQVKRSEYNKYDYLPCIFWGKNARQISQKNKGSLIKLDGRFQSRTYEKKISNGNYQYCTAYEVSVSFYTYIVL